MRPHAAPTALLLAASCAGQDVTPTVVVAQAPVEEAHVVVGASTSSQQVVRPPSAIAWETSEPAARAHARRAGLPLLVWLYASWDAVSLEMERTTWRAPAVTEAARPFVALRLDLSEAEGDAQRYAEAYDTQVVPATVLFNGRGERAKAFRGLQDPATIAAALHAVADE